MPDAPTFQELIRRVRAWDQDLRQQVRRRLALGQRQRRLELRNQGHDRAAMAARVGGVAESRRKKLAWGVDRVDDEPRLDNEP